MDVNGLNKVSGQGYHILYSKVYRISCTVFRLPNIYGPGMRVKDGSQTFLGICVRSLLFGEQIKMFGDGKQGRDFNYVEDDAAAFLLAGMSDRAIGQVMNLGSSEVINLKDLAEKIMAIHRTGKWDFIPFPPERKMIDIGDYYGDYRLARNILGGG